MACQTVITNVPPAGQAKPASSHNGGGFVRFENCGSWDFWIHDVNANCNSIYNLAKINCIPLIDFLTTPLQVDVDANGHTIYNVGKIYIGSSTDDGSGALLQVAGEINAKSYMLGGFEFASYATPGQIDLTNIYSINGITGFLPSGVQGSIQYNDDGNLTGDSFLIYDEITHNVGIVPLGLGPQWRLDVGGDINIIDPTYTGYAYRINGIPFAIADAGGSHINLINIGTINGAPPGSGGGGGAPGGSPGDVQFNVTGGLFGGSANLFWDNVNGRLGIGTNAPAYPLDVRGNENITGCYYIAGVPFACQSGSGIALQNIVTINGGPPGGAATLPGAPNGSIQFNQSNVFTGSVNLTWDYTNNRLGVGTFAPGYPLDVVGNVNARGCYLISGLTFACSDGAGGINLTNITNINGQPPGTGGGGASVTVSDTPPASPSLGNLWFDSVGTQLYIWYTDPTSSQWVATINQCGSGGGGGAGEFDPTNVLAGTCMTVDYTTTNVTVNANKACIQTPWVVNEDASNYSLSNVQGIGVGAAASSPGIFILRPVGSPLAMNIRGAGPSDFSAQIQIINDTNSGLYLGVPGSAFPQPGQPGNAIIRSTNDMLFATTTNTLERARITQAGLVGIGTSAPTTLVQGVAQDPAIYLLSNTDNGDGTFSNILMAAVSNSTTNPTLAPYADSSVIMTQNGMELFLASADAISMIPGAAGFYAVPITTGTGGYAFAVDYASTNVGVHTVTPKMPLDVIGGTRISVDAPSLDTNLGISQLKLCGQTNQNETLWMGFDTTNLVGVIQAGVAFVGWNNLILNPVGGNVGIGTTNPGYLLDVAGRVRSNSANGGNFIYPAESGHEWWIGAYTDFTSFQITHVTAGSGGNINPFTILTSGRVGIGTTGPQAPLHVNGINEGLIISSDDSSDNYSIYRFGGNGNLYFQGNQSGFSGYVFRLNASQDVVTIVNQGFVGIGTTNPQAPLHVMPDTVRIESIAGSNAYAQVQLFGGGPTNGRSWRMAAISDGGYAIERIDDSVGAPARMIAIQRGGNVGIGTISPASLLDVGVDGPFSLLSCACLGGHSNTAYQACLTVQSDRAVPSPPNNAMTFNFSTSSRIMQFIITDASGNVHTANLQFT